MNPKITYSLFILLAIIGTIILGYFTQQNEFTKIALGYGLMWIFYIFAIKKQSDSSPQWKPKISHLIFFGIFLRLLLIPIYPPLSDDYFRFVWDGYCNSDGLSPYDLKPEDFNAEQLGDNYKIIYEELNSKIYYSVYPPLLQSVFTLSAWLFPKNLLGSVIVMRLVLILFEIGSIFFISRLLKRFSLPDWQVLLYALNPLVIIEISGNLHFEGMMIFFMLGSIYFLSKIPFEENTNTHFNKNHFLSASFLGLAAGAKLLPLMFMPIFIQKIGWVKSIIYGCVVGLVFLLSFFMLWDIELFLHFKESIRLYYQSFEFNGGIYYLLRKTGYLFRGYNEIAYIGPGMAIISALSIILFSLKDNNKNFARIPILFLFALTIYQLLSTTVHPWYIAPFVALASLTRFRFAILWSGLILLTYINYSNQPYYENLWFVALEYILVIGVLAWELKNKQKRIITNKTEKT